MLSRMQSQMVADTLEKLHPGLAVELVIIKTSGDQIVDRPLHEAGGKGLFTKELEQALFAGAIDFAVHSFKDVPVTMPLVDVSSLAIAAVPKREDPRDVLVSQKAKQIEQLPRGAKVGTGSLRRRCQLLALRPDLQVELIRGNVDTRIKKQRGGEFDAVILAYAGLKRSGLFDDVDMTAIDTDQMLPAAAQGALAIQCRASDAATRELLSAMNDHASFKCVEAERAVVRALNGDCHSPIAAMAAVTNGVMELRAAVGKRDGETPVIQARGPTVQDVVSSLIDQGAREMLS